MPLYRKRKKEKETKWAGVGDLKLLKSGHMRLFPTLNNEEILEYLPLKSVHESFGFGLCSQVNGGCWLNFRLCVVSRGEDFWKNRYKFTGCCIMIDYFLINIFSMLESTINSKNEQRSFFFVKKLICSNFCPKVHFKIHSVVLIKFTFHHFVEFIIHNLPLKWYTCNNHGFVCLPCGV